MINIKGCRVYFRQGKVRKSGVITKELTQSEDGIRRVEVRLDRPMGKKITVVPDLCSLWVVPRKTPATWRRVLRDNAHVKGISDVAVCYTQFNDSDTTLFHTKTLRRLRLDVTDKTTCSVVLREGDDRPSEGREELDYSESAYLVGPVEIEIKNVNIN